MVDGGQDMPNRSGQKRDMDAMFLGKIGHRS
jgi:hypothetical protein